MRNVHRGLVGISLYELSNNYIHKLRSSKFKPDAWHTLVPEYTIATTESGKNIIHPCEYYLQFVGFTETPENEKYLVFDLNSIDNLINEEVSASDWDDFFKDVDFKKILDVFPKQTDYDMKNHSMPRFNYLVVDLEYDFSYDHDGGYDSEMYVNVVGYLNHNMELVKFETNVL